MFLTKEQKKELKSKNIFYYSPVTYFFLKVLIILILIFTTSSSFKEVSKKLVESNLSSSSYIYEIAEFIFISAIIFLLTAVFYALISSKFYLVSFRFKPKFKLPFSLYKGLKEFISSLLFTLAIIFKLVVIIFLFLMFSWTLRFTDFSNNTIFNILEWLSSSYWQLIVICSILFVFSFIFSYIYFNFKHYLKLKGS